LDFQENRSCHSGFHFFAEKFAENLPIQRMGVLFHRYWCLCCWVKNRAAIGWLRGSLLCGAFQHARCPFLSQCCLERKIPARANHNTDGDSYAEENTMDDRMDPKKSLALAFRLALNARLFRAGEIRFAILSF
jgi:hypothetical protein